MWISKFKWRLPMLGFFKNKKKENKDIDEEGKSYDPDNIIVYYEGTLISPEYATQSLVYPNNGTKVREDFNNQGYPYHNLFPHGEGKMTYKDGDDIVEQYEGEFHYGQYHGTGTLIDRHGEVLEGTFKENKFIKN